METSVDQILALKGSTVHRIAPYGTVREAVLLMNHHNIGSLLVIDGAFLMGIFTERDVLTRVIGEGRDPVTTKVEDVMTRSLVTLPRTCTLRQALGIVDSKRCRHLPVVEGNRVLGLVSIGDLTRGTIRYLESDVVELSRYITTPYLANARMPSRPDV